MALNPTNIPLGLFAPPRPPEQKRQRFIEGGKFTGKDALGLALGAIGDAFTGTPTTAQFLFEGIANRRKAEQEQQALAAKRAAELEDFAAKRRLEIENPIPDSFVRALQGANIDLTSPEARKLFADRAAGLAANPNDEFVSVEIPGRGRFAGPKSALPTFIGGGVPTRPVGALKPVPGTQAPQMIVTPIELDALVRRFGPDEVQARIDAGIVAVRNN